MDAVHFIHLFHSGYWAGEMEHTEASKDKQRRLPYRHVFRVNTSFS